MECYGLLVTPRCEPEPSEVHLPNPELAGYYVGEFPYKWPYFRKMGRLVKYYEIL